MIIMLRSLTLVVLCLLSIRGACVAAEGVQPRTGLTLAWEPYQELFLGVVTCIHADFRIGGLDPGETKHIRGKIYLVPADVPALLGRYEHDFPEHITAK
jgi:hypothetical protein